MRGTHTVKGALWPCLKGERNMANIIKIKNYAYKILAKRGLNGALASDLSEKIAESLSRDKAFDDLVESTASRILEDYFKNSVIPEENALRKSVEEFNKIHWHSGYGHWAIDRLDRNGSTRVFWNHMLVVEFCKGNVRTFDMFSPCDPNVVAKLVGETIDLS